MQTETLYGSRGRALVSALVPVGAAVLLFGNLLGDNRMGSFGFLVILGLAAFGIVRAGDLINRRQLVLDRDGFVFHPSFGTESEKIRWNDVRSFEIKGSNKHKHLVCLHLSDDQRTVSTMKLGTDWCLDADSLWGVSLDKVQGHLSDYHRKAAGQGVPVRSVNRSATVSPVAVPSEVAPSMATKSVAAQPVQTAAVTRSGAVYAERPAATPRPTMPSLNGQETSLKGLGLGLIGAGMVVAALSLIPFIVACKRDLCSVGLWEMGDYRLWLFATLWTVSLLVVVAGWKLVSSARSTRL